MEFVAEYSLLVVVATPVVVVATMNAVLAAIGETGTLLFPSA